VLDREHHFVGQPDETVAFVLTLDAINFGSGYFPYLRKRRGLSGYFTIATSLTERFRERGPFTAEQLVGLTEAACAELFGQDLEVEPVRELMGLFATALNDLGGYLLTSFDGRFVGLVEAADSSAERLARLLVEMPFFRDVAAYGELEAAFYKRAQLTPADLALSLGGHPYGAFYDLDRLTIFADNLVPHVLRVDGVLRYDDGLAARIDAGEPIVAGSREEVEIRATAVQAVELMVEILSEVDQPVSAHQLDYLLWNRGQLAWYKSRPRHRARSVYY
jgi:hypothetical protein